MGSPPPTRFYLVGQLTRGGGTLCPPLFISVYSAIIPIISYIFWELVQNSIHLSFFWRRTASWLRWWTTRRSRSSRRSREWWSTVEIDTEYLLRNDYWQNKRLCCAHGGMGLLIRLGWQVVVGWGPHHRRQEEGGGHQGGRGHEQSKPKL